MDVEGILSHLIRAANARILATQKIRLEVVHFPAVHKKKTKKPPGRDWPEVEINAKTFQKQLGELTNTISLKVEREGVKRLKP